MHGACPVADGGAQSHQGMGGWRIANDEEQRSRQLEAEQQRQAEQWHAERAQGRQRRQAEREEERRLRRTRREAYYRRHGVEPGLWAWYQVLPDWTQAVLMGLAFSGPVLLGALVYAARR